MADLFTLEPGDVLVSKTTGEAFNGIMVIGLYAALAAGLELP